MEIFLSNWMGGKAADSPSTKSPEPALSRLWETQKVCLAPPGNPHPHLIVTIPMRRSDGEVWCVVRPDGRWNVNTNAGTKTSRKTQADAEAFCDIDAARMNPSLLLPKTKSTAAPAGRSSRHAYR